MNEGEGPVEAIDLRLDRTKDSEAEVDTATYVAAKFFGAVALPIGVSFAKAAAIEAQANFTQKLDGAETFINGGAGAGPIGELTPEQRQKKLDEESLAYLAFVADEVDRQREREEWSRTVTTVGGVSMSGAEWQKLAERLRDDEDLHRRLIEAFEKRGMTEKKPKPVTSAFRK